MAAQCLSCGHSGMLFDDHHGMEYNVCEQCGTVIECVPLVVNIYQNGTREVPCNYLNKPVYLRKGVLLNPDLKPFSESKEIMCQLMDRLNIPMAARELAVQFLQYTKAFDKRCSVGACVYLAMKRHDIPITIKYLSNYLQVSHYLIGRVMKKLEKRIGPSAQSSAFSVDKLLHLIYSEAKFGGDDGGKKRLELLLSKTEILLQLLQEYQISVNYHPHLIILAAGYCVWRNLLILNWKGMKNEKGSDVSCMPSFGKTTMKTFLEEVGIQLSNHNTLDEKVNLITATLKNCACHIPWLPDQVTKDMIFIHLDDFLKYKSQLVALAAQDMPKEQNIKVEDLGEDSIRSCEGPSESCENDKINKTDVNIKGVDSSNLDSSQERYISKCSFTVSLDDNLGFASVLVKAESDEDVGENNPVFRKVKFTKITSLSRVSSSHGEHKRDIRCSCERMCQNGDMEDRCDKCVAESLKISKKKCYPSCFDFP